MYSERKFTEAMLLIAGLFACLVMAVLLFTAPASAAEKTKPKAQTLFINCNIFDGKADGKRAEFHDSLL